jgi:predicted transcriptional regulator
MSQAKLIERGPEGTYSTTRFGRLLMTLSVSMNLVYKNDDYFLTHSLSSIPLPFVNRIGELSQSTLVSDLNEDLSRWDALVKAAKEHVWVITPKAMEHLSKVMADRLLEDVKLRSIFREDMRESKVSLPSGKNVERKLIQEVPVIMIISEKEASVSFPRLNGNVDFPSFFGNDPIFLRWANDLYLDYWNQAKIWRPST